MNNNEVKVQKKGRRNKGKVYNVIAQSIEPVKTIDENIILHLPLITESDLKNDVVPYDMIEDNYALISNEMKIKLSELDETEEDIKMDDITNSLILPKEDINKRVTEDNHNSIKNIKLLDCLYDFTLNNPQKKWVNHPVNVACYWCCHKFSNIPVGIPKKYFNGKFYLYGCFCSYNCASAHLMNSNNNERWEQYSLLNYMYSFLNKCSPVKIKLAPRRELLTLFGGPLSIEQFRNASLQNDKNYNVLEPPLVSLSSQIEETTIETVPKFQSFFKPREEAKLAQKPVNSLENYLSLKRK